MPRSALAAVFLLAMALIASSLPSSARADELLTNNGFESGVGAWATTHGDLDTVSSPVRSGVRAARLSSAALQSHEVYRSAAVAPGQPYRLSGWLLLNDPAIERLFLRISWFDSSGGLISQADSPWLTISASAYQPLTTGDVISPLAAVTARIGVRVQALGQFNLYLDDFSFTGAIAPPPVSTPAPTGTPASTGTPSPSTRTPTPTPRPSGTAQPDEEPDVFDALTNGGFETLRADGTAYGWKDIGADLSTTSSPVVEGSHALAVVSHTSSTKWAYQTVRVRPGEFLDAAAYAWSGGGAETFLRVSWYASADGSGAAIDSVDSTSGSSSGDRFDRLTTGPVEAPLDAHTAKVRLMLRPPSESQVTVYFDAVSFEVTTARPVSPEGTGSGSGGSSTGDVSSSSASGSRHDGVPFDALVEHYPLGFANVRPLPTAAPAAVASNAVNYDWLAVLGVVLGGGVIAFAAYLEWHHRRKADRGDST